MVQARPEIDDSHQLALHDGWTAPRARRGTALRRRPTRRDNRQPPLCAGCREKEARYGFRDDHDDPVAGRPRTLCFECFRMEIARRQAMAAYLARGWNAQQVRLPLEETLRALTTRRRRAQIAARRALGA